MKKKPVSKATKKHNAARMKDAVKPDPKTEVTLTRMIKRGKKEKWDPGNVEIIIDPPPHEKSGLICDRKPRAVNLAKLLKDQSVRDQILTWLTAHPLINISKLERYCNMPGGIINKAQSGERDLPEKHVMVLAAMLSNYGFRPE